MTYNRYLGTLVAIAVLAVATQSCYSQELKRSGRYFVAELSKSFKVDHKGELIVEDVRGDVSVQGWDKKEVHIKELKKMDVFTRAEAETILEKSRSSYHQSGNTITIGGEYFRRDWIESEFTIKVPSGFNTSVGTRGGDITIGDVEGSVSLKTSGGDISLSRIGGKINARTSGGDVAVVDVRNEVTLKTSGGDIVVSNVTGHLLAKTSGGDISIAKVGGSVDVHTSGGSIAIADANSGVKAKTSGGDIELRGTEGAVAVHTSGGDITLLDVGGALEASTSGGDISGRRVGGRAQVTTSGGDIRLDDVIGGVYGKTAGGDIEVKIGLEDFSKPHEIDLRSAGGEIELTIPEKMPATIRAEIDIDGRWEDYNIYSDFPLTSASDSESERRRRRRYVRSEGDINGGGDLIQLYTTNGDIYIKKR